ncbi:hypothetical protein HU200_014783 [Digitaria exilis]|uniref:Uncharacterized protein n=1 Tax=Digitaria exilis TaxID=1010633 RepID=A0A835FB39_9POAL|nr:hypothetical protein HU200_014783 [Digitaria exilis]
MGHLFLLLLALLLTASAHASTHGHDKPAFTEDKSIAGIIGVIGSRPPSCAGGAGLVATARRCRCPFLRRSFRRGRRSSAMAVVLLLPPVEERGRPPTTTTPTTSR